MTLHPVFCPTEKGFDSFGSESIENQYGNIQDIVPPMYQDCSILNDNGPITCYLCWLFGRQNHDVPVELEVWKIKINLIVMDEKNVDCM
ncbi:hypothetical protein SAMN04487931_10846 [Desulfobacula phenolica]|uniref:Uncharacterized protein n=1 Tax=Desulfobacula phenolica TaxID=90732 RepID=A0A1H2IBC7_9BACT|nr:hypothetical protein SAMN04487931_10846 [Desulfobacula phenolica]